VKTLDGVKVGGWWAEDFTAAEIRADVRAQERLRDLRTGNNAFNDTLVLPTPQEVIDLAKSSPKPLNYGTPAFGATGKTAPSLAIFAERLATLPLVYQPGTRWSYSVGLDLLGRIIELASGQPFDAFLKARIFDPLGMTSTTFRVPAADAARLTTNYFVSNGQLLPIDSGATSIYLDQPAFPFGGAGLVSSPRDYDRFLAMVLNGGMCERYNRKMERQKMMREYFESQRRR
jgi:CubicO group peptidase (beta-lactamase class C family)